MIRYLTRIGEHIHLASAARIKQGGEPINMKEISRETGVPYSTVRRYANDPQANPNFAVANKIRLHLNQFLPEEKRLSDAGYIYPAEAEQEGQRAAYAVA